MSDNLGTQVRRNLVAIISLTLALSSLAYNTWRNEKTEANRNIREAGFEVLVEIGKFQRIVFFSHYENNDQQGNPRTGWSHVLVIYDLSQMIPEPVPSQAALLKATWEAHWDKLGEVNDSVDSINAAIDSYRLVVLATLQGLR